MPERISNTSATNTSQISHVNIFDLIPKESRSAPNKRLANTQSKPLMDTDEKAIVEGAVIDLKEKSYCNKALIDILIDAANGSNGISFIDDNGVVTHILYSELLKTAYNIAEKLQQEGVKPNDSIIVCLDIKKQFVEVFWACQIIGAVVLPVSIPSEAINSETIDNFLDIWQLLSSPYVIFADTKQSSFLPEPKAALLVDDLMGHQCTNIAQFSHPSPQNSALMLLTSGSTGKPKLVKQSHQTILARCQSSWQHDGFNSDDVSLNFLPLDHVGGLVMFHIRDIWTSCQQIQAPMNLFLENPLVWLDWIDKFRVTITWAPNFAFALINSQKDNLDKRHWDLRCLRFILNGGERIVAAQAQEFIQLMNGFDLPNNAMRPAWGMSETCSGVTSSAIFTIKEDISPPSVSLGPPLPGTSLRIVNDKGEILFRNQEGELEVNGPTITSGYHINDEANSQSFTTDGWFKTGDLAIIDLDGCLHITGRSKQIMIVNGRNISLSEIETVLESMTELNTSSVTALVVEKNNSGEEMLALIFGYSKSTNLETVIEEINSQTLSIFGIRPSITVPLPYEKIPRSSIGKVDRKELKRQLQENELNDYVQKKALSIAPTDIIPDAFFKQHYYKLELEEKYSIKKNQRLLVIADNENQSDNFFSENDFDIEHCSTLIYHHKDYEQQLEAKLKSESKFNFIVHLGGFTSSESVVEKNSTGNNKKLLLARSIIILAKIINNLNITTTAIIVTHKGQQVVNEKINDIEVNPEKAALLGLIEVLNKEIHNSHFKIIDSDELNFQSLGKAIFQKTSFTQIAFRQGIAYRLGIKAINMVQKEHYGLPFAEGELVLITGGLGGVAFEISQLLLRRYKVSLALVGRTPLPEQEFWPLICAEGGSIATRIRRLQALQKIGDVCYEATDIANEAIFKNTITSLENQKNKKVCGVVHTAGILAAGKIAEFNELLLDASLKAKQAGTEILYKFFSHRKQFKFIAISSTTGFLGGTSLAAYSVANAYLNNFCQQQSHVNTWVINYGRWDDTGLAAGRNDQEALIAEGYIPLKPIEAGQALLAILEREPNNYIYGLDEQGVTVSKYLENGIPLPSSPSNDISHQKEKETIDIISRVFKQVLNMENLNLDDNYFDLGVHSLLIPQLKKKIFDEIGYDVPTVEFFRATNIATLSAYIIKNFLKTPSQNSDENKTVTNLSKVFEEVLKIDELKLTDNYFDLGVHSLLIPQLKKKVFERMGYDVPTVEFFRATNINALSEYIALNFIEASSKKTDESKILTDVTEIFEEVLGIENITLTDNYFDLGVHSLVIPQLKKKVFEKTGCDVPTVEFFHSINIDALSRYIEQSVENNVKTSNTPTSTIISDPQLMTRNATSLDSSLVSMKLGGSKSPMFLVHDGDGETVLYAHLARYLDDNRPVYGIRPHNKEGFPILHTRISDMAAYYIEKMRTIQERGPYLVGGLCAGGVLAFEVACQLQAQGEKVELLALLDAADDQSVSEKSWHTRKRRNRLSEALGYSQELKAKQKYFYIINTLLAKLSNTLIYECINIFSRIKNKIKMNLYRYYLDNGHELPKFLQDIPVRVAYQFAVKESKPENYQGDVVLFRATEKIINNDPLIDDTPNIEKHRDPLFGWGHRVKGEIMVCDIPGGHSSCLHEPHVQTLAKKMESFIKENV